MRPVWDDCQPSGGLFPEPWRKLVDFSNPPDERCCTAATLPWPGGIPRDSIRYALRFPPPAGSHVTEQHSRKETDFGFEQVAWEDKARRVQDRVKRFQRRWAPPDIRSFIRS